MMRVSQVHDFRYPRRRWIRAAIHHLTYGIFRVLADFQVVGGENLPERGPLLVVGNHFSFLDPVAMVSVVPWPMEFVGGFRVPNAPSAVAWLRKMWGYYPVYRGTGSQIAFRAAQAILEQGGILGIFPEGSSGAAVLRPPRPGAAFMAARAGVRVLPFGLDGLTEVFPALRRGRRARVTIRVGKLFGPFTVEGRGRARRAMIDAIGHEIMRRIAELLPHSRRGYYSSDPVLRAEALEAAYYPWDEVQEG
ncbi:MAG TPA: 1-acyl-sn-glycerol-3-phosphate acyltransferase [Chloroflexi bacterium]|nr:1-acyl-sn-glycerol-3-phosphate acyltransferase [Chloroflexota bacterium]